MSLQQRAVFAAIIGFLSATLSVGFVAPALAAPALPTLGTVELSSADLASTEVVSASPLVAIETIGGDAPSGETDMGSLNVDPAVMDVAGGDEANTLTPVILAAGLAVMFAAILMVVRSGSSKEPEAEQISPLTDRS